MSKRRRPILLGHVGMLLVAAGAIACAHGAEVQVVRIDGTTIHGEWMGLDATPGTAILLAHEGNPRSVRLEEISSIAVGAAESRDSGLGAGEDQSAATFYLGDGTRLWGRIIGWDADAVIARTVVSEETRFPLDRLAAVQWLSAAGFPRANELFGNALGERLPGQDVLITAGGDEPKVLRGRVERIDAESGSFSLSGQVRTFQTGKAFGVVFAVGGSRPASGGVQIELHEGSLVVGRIAGAGVDSVRLETSLGLTKEFPLSAIQQIVFRNERVTYLSELRVLEEQYEGRLHRLWPMQRNKNVSGGRLELKGRRFEKGLGVHSYTAVSYEVGPDYDSFAATIGLDDAVRPRGNVVFRVLGDGRSLYDSGLLNGRDEPKDIVVDVRGIKKLTLVVDFGDALDLSDQADWGGARLLRMSVK